MVRHFYSILITDTVVLLFSNLANLFPAFARSVARHGAHCSRTVFPDNHSDARASSYPGAVLIQEMVQVIPLGCDHAVIRGKKV